MHDCPNLFPIEWVQSDNLRGKNLFNNVFYGNLSLTIGVWTRRGICDAGDPLIGIDFEENMLCRVYFPGGKLQRSDIWNVIWDRLTFGDLQGCLHGESCLEDHQT